MTSPFPHRYIVSLAHDELFAPPRQPIRAGAPPQFGGSEQVWSPEELLVASAMLCLKTTFDAFARRENLAVLDWQAVGTGTLVKAAGGPTFSSIELDVALTTMPGDETRATDVLQQAERHCIIANALKVPVHVRSTATAAAASAAS
ncbi:MAG TPA: OsmC family protein [Kofleriaceae bacterium]